MRSWFWCLRIILIALFSLFFLAFGIQALIASYSMKNPYEFIMHFFSSSLIILISIVGIIYPAFRLRAALKHRTKAEDDE